MTNPPTKLSLDRKPVESVDAELPILVFDGYCNVCNALVSFVLRCETQATIRFAPASGAIGAALCIDSAIPDAPELTFVFYEAGQYLERSDAALALTNYLRAPWRWFGLFRYVPRPIRDAVYNLIARNRYRLFGRQDHCMVPDSGIAARFLN